MTSVKDPLFNLNISVNACLLVSPRTPCCRQREMGGFYFRAAGWYKQEKHRRLGERPCHSISSTSACWFFDFFLNICGCLLKVNTHHIQSASDDEVDFKDSGFHQDSSLQQVRTPYTWRGTVVFILTSLIPNQDFSLSLKRSKNRNLISVAFEILKIFVCI